MATLSHSRAASGLAFAFACTVLLAALPGFAADERTELPVTPGRQRPPAEARQEAGDADRAPPAEDTARDEAAAGHKKIKDKGKEPDAEKAADKAAPEKAGAVKQSGLVKTFPAGTPDAVLREAFRCALDMNDSDGFSCYLKINRERNQDTDIALAQLKAYSWRAFRNRAASYVMDPKEFAIKVMRRDPSTVGESAKTAKIFLFSKERDNPAPIEFCKENGTWKIYSNSL